MKRCPRCKTSSEFYKGSRWCKECTKSYQRERYKRPYVRQLHVKRMERMRNDPIEKQKNTVRSFNFYHSIGGRAKTLIKGAERRARGRGEPCTVSLEFIEAGIARGFCEVTKIPFAMGVTSPKGMHPFAPSIDRIDCNKPYSNENCRIVIWAYNMMKGNMTDAELYLICSAVVRER